MHYSSPRVVWSSKDYNHENIVSPFHFFSWLEFYSAGFSNVAE